MKSHTISNKDDVIDSRDVIARIEELTEESERWSDEDNDAEELRELMAFAEEGENYSSDWKHGETLIRDSYFVRWCQEFAEDLGALKNANWPLTCIDWEKAARELQYDYTSIDFAGVEYWIRNG